MNKSYFIKMEIINDSDQIIYKYILGENQKKRNRIERYRIILNAFFVSLLFWTIRLYITEKLSKKDCVFN